MSRCDTVSIPFVDLVAQHAPLKDELLAACQRVFEHGQFILGPEVTQLEDEWAEQCRARHAIGVSNGTDALTLVLEAMGVVEGDEVITPPNSFVASTSAIVHAGATPRFADVGEDLNLDPSAVRSCISRRTRGIIAVHLTGRPADMDAINDIASTHGLFVIEDAAQAMGAAYRGNPVGGLASAACFSLHPLKTAGACGDGGVITTNDADLADRLRRARNHGLSRRQEDCASWGRNARLDTLQAALTLVKLRHLTAWNEQRRSHAASYRRLLPPTVRIPQDRPDDFAVYHTFPIETDRRDQLAEHLEDNGIGHAIHYRLPMHLLPAARHLGYRRGDFPVAERQASRILSLPIHHNLCEDQIRQACEVITAFHSG